MELTVHQLGIFLFAADASANAPQPSMLETVQRLVVGSIPTILLFIILVLAYQFLVQGPLSRTLRERRARTEGAMEEAQRALARAEERALEYATKLRSARADVFKMREQRIKQWTAERDAALDVVRKSAGQKVTQAKAEIEAEAANARSAIQLSAGELANRVVRAVLPMAAGGTR
jgi:F-type H+-transporting ATPase subunit b